MSASTRDDDAPITAINVTPLVDVVLVLLVVLMVTASYITRRALPLEPPEARNGVTASAAALEISIDREGRVYVDATSVSEAELRDRVHRYASTSSDAHATVAADRATAHGDVVRVLDVLQAEHLHRVAIRVRPPTL